MSPIKNRYDFTLIFDVTDGNPNGDPDAGNMPRIDPETNQGLVSDVCLKRKVRNYVEMAREGEAGHEIYVKEGSVLNDQQRRAYVAIRGDETSVQKAKTIDPKGPDEARRVIEFMTTNFFDVRTFGAVMSTGVNCGQVKGPVQIGFARSVEPIMPQEVTITRMAATKDKEELVGSVATTEEGAERRVSNQTMGRKFIVPYGLYVVHGYVSAKLAERSGFSEGDMTLLLEALQNMFDHDRSASRGTMVARKLIVFKHESAMGNAHAHKLFDLVRILRKADGNVYPIGGGEASALPPARRFSDYAIEIDSAAVPAGVTLTVLD